LSLDALKFPTGKVNVLYTVKKCVRLPGEAGQVEYSEVRLQVTARVRDVDSRLLHTKVVFTIIVKLSLKPGVIAFQFHSDKSCICNYNGITQSITAIFTSIANST
jgi:hypothetical protein